MRESPAVPTSYKVEVQTVEGGRWSTNALRFADPVQAGDYALNLTMRWSAVREARVADSDDAVNATFGDDGLMLLPQAPVS